MEHQKHQWSIVEHQNASSIDCAKLGASEEIPLIVTEVGTAIQGGVLEKLNRTEGDHSRADRSLRLAGSAAASRPSEIRMERARE
jgi:hypothetical protein